MASSSACVGLLVSICVLLQFCAALDSCSGRCGETFSRGRVCHCDDSCLSHGECCGDFESMCTTAGSCQGRCGEPYKRGGTCECDPDCALYNQCCPDYQSHCLRETTTRPERTMTSIQKADGKSKTESPKKKPSKKPELKLLTSKPPISESEEIIPEIFDSEFVSTLSPPILDLLETRGYEVTIPPVPSHSPVPANNVFAPSESPEIMRGFEPTASAFLPSGSPLNLVLPNGKPLTEAAVPPRLCPCCSKSRCLTPHLTAGMQQQTAPPPPETGPHHVFASLGVSLVASHDQAGPADTRTPSSGVAVDIPRKLAVGPHRPSTLADITEALMSGNPSDDLPNADDPSDTNLCNGQPIDGITTLLNGTIVIFRGHFFWTVDVNWVSSPAQRIRDVWGIPSPIDTVFTRSNCQGKTYIFKGNSYWRFENGVMDPGYPKTISVGFDGLSGKITAVLSVPATRRRPESVYFFKKGGLVQKYEYESETSPVCEGALQFSIHGGKNRPSRQAATRLGKEIQIKLTWKGLPSLVTAAVSMPSPRKPDGYDYYIFSKDKVYNIKLIGERLALAPPQAPAPKLTSIRDWLRCP